MQPGEKLTITRPATALLKADLAVVIQKTMTCISELLKVLTASSEMLVRASRGAPGRVSHSPERWRIAGNASTDVLSWLNISRKISCARLSVFDDMLCRSDRTGVYRELILDRRSFPRTGSLRKTADAVPPSGWIRCPGSRYCRSCCQ